MRINDVVKALRKRDNLTQVDLAEKLNCNRQKIADWERGKSAPSVDDIILLRQIFNVSADYLLGLTNVATPDKDVQFICEYTGLTENAVSSLHYSTIKGVSHNDQTFINYLTDGNKMSEWLFLGYYIERYESALVDYIDDCERVTIPYLNMMQELQESNYEKCQDYPESLDDAPLHNQELLDEKDLREFQLVKQFYKLLSVFVEDLSKHADELSKEISHRIEVGLDAFETYSGIDKTEQNYESMEGENNGDDQETE